MIHPRTKKTNELTRFIPRDFNYLLKTPKLEYCGKKLKTAYLINMMSEFINKTFSRKNDILENEIKFNLCSMLLKSNYGQTYNYYINWLIDNEFLILVSNYYVSVKSRSYRVNHQFLNNIIRVNVYDKVLLKKNTSEYLRKSFVKNSKSPIPIELRERLTDILYEVDVDIDAAANYVEQARITGALDYKKYMKNYLSIQNLKYNNMFFNFDKYGRMHTNYTVLKKHIRQQYLSLDNQPLVEVDLSNSQPLFLGVLMKNELPANKIIQPDITRYIELVKTGLIYEELMTKSNIIVDRQEAKLIMYKILFGVNSLNKVIEINGKNINADRIFYDTFPNVYDFIKTYKDGKKNYKRLSHTLQRLESDFIFGDVITHLMKSDPEIKVITVHDSLCFPIKHQERVKDIFNYYKRNLL